MYRRRRNTLLKELETHSSSINNYAVMMCANFEQSRHAFQQNSSFFYLTGIEEPAAVLIMQRDGRTILYVPDFGTERGRWVENALTPQSDPLRIGVDEIRPLGPRSTGYAYSSIFDPARYAILIKDLTDHVQASTTIYAIRSSCGSDDQPVNLLAALTRSIPGLAQHQTDCAPMLAALRRRKDNDELRCMERAARVTCEAQREAARVIMPGKHEYDVHAIIAHTFERSGGYTPAFPSIVATGKNASILHYQGSTQQIAEEDLVVVDIGAQYNGYAADITRTYPAGGRFTSRQAQAYDLVLEAHEYAVSLARPGMFLRHDDYPEKSLTHLIRTFFRQHGVEKQFYHGLGHYLGLDVHDVGSYATPLQEGDVITIEPGLYFPDEQMGIRLEDDYLVIAGGVRCLSENLPKDRASIEELVR